MSRPLCACCNKPYGSRNVDILTVFCPDTPDGKLPIAAPYRGNAELTSEVYVPDEKGWRAGHRRTTQFGEPPEAPRPSDGAAARVEYQRKVVTNQITGRVCTRKTWDGSYRTPYKPFCTLRCARAFATLAHASGWRIKR